MLQVADTDATLERARERGAVVQREPYENYGARSATIVDPFGHRWMLSGPVTGAPIPIQHGDVGYVSVWTPDADRAAAFYGQVLGWTYDPQTHQVTNTKEHIGIYSVDGPPTLFCCYAVADLDGARQAIVAGGGTVDELEQFDFGTLQRRHRLAGDVVRRIPAEAGSAAARAQRLWARRTFVHHLRGDRLDGLQGVLQPRAVLDLRAGPDRRRLGRCSRPTRWPGSRAAAPSR